MQVHVSTDETMSVDFSNHVTVTGTNEAGTLKFAMIMAIANDDVSVSATCRIEKVRRRMMSDEKKNEGVEAFRKYIVKLSKETSSSYYSVFILYVSVLLFLVF